MLAFFLTAVILFLASPLVINAFWELDPLDLGGPILLFIYFSQSALLTLFLLLTVLLANVFKKP